MKEDIYNLYLITHGHFITQLGAKVYHIDGTDTEKSTFLKENAEKDAKNIDYFNVPSNYQAVINGEKREGLIRPEKYLQLTMIGKGIEIFSEVLESYNAPTQPLCCISHLVDGIFRKEGESKLSSNSEEYKLIRFHEAEGFLEKYTHDGSFHILELLNDDFFSPIKLLADNNYLIAATKLLFSTIDSFAFLRYGDQKGIFKQWLENYVSLPDLHVTSEELWELRNSLIHMTNYDSRRNINGSIARVMIYSGIDTSEYSNSNNKQKLLNFNSMYKKTFDGVVKWLSEIMKSQDEKDRFIQNYRFIASDFRLEGMSLWK